MEDRNYLNLVARKLVKDCKREATYNGAPQSSINARIESWITGDSRKRFINVLHEFEIETLALVRVPFASFCEFCIGFGSEPNDHSA